MWESLCSGLLVFSIGMKKIYANAGKGEWKNKKINSEIFAKKYYDRGKEVSGLYKNFVELVENEETVFERNCLWKKNILKKNFRK
jgi:hypothetical protein